MVYLFNAIQEFPQFSNNETIRLARNLQRDTKTVGPESVDSIASLLHLCAFSRRERNGVKPNSDRQKIIDESSAMEFTSRLIGAIGKNNVNFRDTRRGNVSEENHFGERYSQKEVKYINTNAVRKDCPSEIMDSIDFVKNQHGYIEAIRKKTLCEIYRERLESFVFGQQCV
jgi:hypothetical protein